MLLLTRSQAVGVPEANVGRVSSQLGSSSHLPPYSSQPDPYPRSSLAQQARCLILTRKDSCWGGGVAMLGQTKAGRAEGAPQTGPLTWSLAWQGQTGPDRQHRVCSPPPLLSATQTPGAEGETEEGGGGLAGEGGGKWASEHNEETDTEYPTPPSSSALHCSLSKDLNSLWAGCCPVLSPV